MPKRDPHDVLGVPRGASQATIKAAWRKLAREHHPDLAAGDPAAARSATRRMAEINEAYERLRVGSPSAASMRRGAARSGESDGDGFDGAGGRRTTVPPRPRPTRPVTGRLDTTHTFRPRNATTSGPRPRRDGPIPPRSDRLDREPPRASDPTGPALRGRQPHFRPPELPDLGRAAGTVIGFGKFHGHTLGEIAAFEPSYIDWLVRAITRDPDLLFAAKAMQRDLDARGVVRRSRPDTSRGARSPFAYPDHD